MIKEAGEYKALLKKLKSKGGLKQISCEFCLREVTTVNYIKCSVCANIFLCVKCYSEGREKGDHVMSHPYQIISPLKFPLFDPGWTTKEEMMLLEGLQKFGYGNWGSIAEYLNSSKTMGQCEAHYRRFYLQSKTSPLPDTSVVLSERDQNGCVAIYMDRFIEQMDVTEPEEELQIQPEPEKHPLSEFAGFMPKRRDFEVEFENDAEMYLADLEFYEDDTAEDRQIKFRQLDVYNKVLDEREERKNFVIDRWPIELENEKKFKGPIERPIFAAMKPFARFLPPEKHLSLCQALAQEYILRMKLEELKQAKAAGVSTEQEFIQFLARRKTQLNSARQREYDSVVREYIPKPDTADTPPKQDDEIREAEMNGQASSVDQAPESKDEELPDASSVSH